MHEIGAENKKRNQPEPTELFHLQQKSMDRFQLHSNRKNGGASEKIRSNKKHLRLFEHLTPLDRTSSSRVFKLGSVLPKLVQEGSN